jgi:formate hydrogenlyase transcriptional activator
MEEISQFERLLTSISLRLEDVSGKSMVPQIRWALEEVAAYFGVQRILLTEFRERPEILPFFIYWSRPGIILSSPEAVAPLLDSWYYRTISGGDIVRLSDVFKDLPPECETERVFCRRMGIKSVLTVPLRFRGKVACSLSLNAVDAPIAWADRTVERASAIGQVLANVIYRKQAEESLHQNLEEIQKLKEHLEAETRYLRAEVQVLGGMEEVIGRSTAFKSSLSLAAQVAPTASTVLLQGETGTGKEVLANLIHQWSPRKGNPLVKVNCPAIPASLFESELFGHEKGAFTGADQTRVGRFEVADGGTLFLDEISELPLEIQAKLLRVIQDGQFQRVGSNQTRVADVRIVAATNRDLGRAVAGGRFRDDLYFRLAVFPITLPPLRDRREDIPLLTWALIGRRQKALGRSVERIPRRAMDALVAYAWPGNVRELENVIERALILSPGNVLVLDEAFGKPLGSPAQESQRMEDVARDHVVAVLERCAWKVGGHGGAAEVLGVHPNTLRSRMKKLGIKRPTRQS